MGILDVERKKNATSRCMSCRTASVPVCMVFWTRAVLVKMGDQFFWGTFCTDTSPPKYNNAPYCCYTIHRTVVNTVILKVWCLHSYKISHRKSGGNCTVSRFIDYLGKSHMTQHMRIGGDPATYEPFEGSRRRSALHDRSVRRVNSIKVANVVA